MSFSNIFYCLVLNLNISFLANSIPFFSMVIEINQAERIDNGIVKIAIRAKSDTLQFIFIYIKPDSAIKIP